MSKKCWNRLTDSLPADGDLVDWISLGGQEVTGGKKGPGKWLLPPNHDMCCLYEPVLWRESDES